MSEMNSPKHWFECEEGYPTEASLARLRAHEFDPFTGAKFMVDDLFEITEGISCVLVKRRSGKNSLGEKVQKIEYHTCGWSGAEDLIDVILSHFWISHLHSKWEKGGHFYFEVLPALLKRRA